MKEELDPHVISTLQMEYNAMREELRDLVNSMDKNLSVGTATLSGVLALAANSIIGVGVLYIVPSVIFIATCIHLVKTASASMHGAYCQVIEARLKLLLGQENVLLDWEGGRISQYISHPNSMVQWGFYIYFSAIFLIFLGLAIFTYQKIGDWKCWSAIIHAIEFIIILVYAILVVRRDGKYRPEIMEYYQAHGSGVAIPDQSPPEIK